MADLTTTYLGLKLPHPLLPGASPLADELDMVRRLRDAGAPAITLRSLLAGPLHPQLNGPRRDRDSILNPRERFLAGLGEPPDFALDPHRYGEHIERVRAAVGPRIPIIASLYALTPECWMTNAKLIEEAGADALEMNIYGMAVAERNEEPMKQDLINTVRALRRALQIPIAVKLLPFDKSLERLVHDLSRAGADGLILFNGFHRSDMAVDRLADPFVQVLANPQNPVHRYRWLARLADRVGADFAFSGGTQTAAHAAKAILCGAHAVQVVTALLELGPEYLADLRDRLTAWIAEHEYASVEEMRGRISRRAFTIDDDFELAFSNRILMHRN